VHSDGSDSIEWNDLEASADEQGEEMESPLPLPKHDADNELDWPGTMAAYRASVEAVNIVLDND
jgi:hypothetical protein